MDWLEFITLVVPGFAASLDFACFIFMQSTCRELPDRERVQLEQRFLRTFNRLTPILNALSILFLLLYAFRFKENNAANDAVWSALFFFSVATAISIWLSRSIEQELAGWNPDQLPENWKSVRTNRAITQGLRASVQLLGFALICGSIAAR
jgi:TRAP-type C4-dicarboxylate transport system permease large subunit